MPTPALTDQELRDTHSAYTTNNGSISATARQLGISRKTVRQRLDQAQARLQLPWGRPLVGGEIEPTPTQTRSLPSRGRIRRYILTAAQNNTHIHRPFWLNLLALAEFHDAEILVSQFTYNKTAYGKKSVKPGYHPTHDDVRELWFDEELEAYVCNDRVELAPSLVFCGEMNTLPTAVRPLSGFETYTGRKSGIFPHAKIAMDSVAAVAEEGAKFNYTTGAVTARNYVKKKSGLKAEHHHTYGALIVEVNDEGNWWVRQINAAEDGTFYEIDNDGAVLFVGSERVSTGHSALGVNWGDVHESEMDPVVRELNWGAGGIMDTLKPAHQFMHDTVNFRPRNHHEMKNPHQLFKKWRAGGDIVEAEFAAVAKLLEVETRRDYCTTHVIDSNHDNAMTRWLREADYRLDPQNAIFFLRSQLKVYEALNRGDEQFHLVEAILREMGVKQDIHFVRDNESLTIAGVEFSMHGHLGPDGARGSPQALSRLGRKANTGHTHKAQILDGMYVAGTCTKLRLDYTKGPSSWSHSHVVTYPNGKRTIITIWQGRWRA